jgi:hypothetical protein
MDPEKNKKIKYAFFTLVNNQDGHYDVIREVLLSFQYKEMIFASDDDGKKYTVFIDFGKYRWTVSLKKMIDLPDSWVFMPSMYDIKMFRETKFANIEKFSDNQNSIEKIACFISDEEKETLRKKKNIEKSTRYRLKMKDQEIKPKQKNRIVTDQQRIQRAARKKELRMLKPTDKQRRLHAINIKHNPYRSCTKEDVSILMEQCNQTDKKTYQELYKPIMEDIWDGKYNWVARFPELEW